MIDRTGTAYFQGTKRIENWVRNIFHEFVRELREVLVTVKTRE